jgi:diguanylate cyclase (GGDEF)-like protein
LRVLFVEDNPLDAEIMVRALEEAGYELGWSRVETEKAFLLGIETAPDVILADYNLPDFGGLRALRALQQRELEIPFILVSGTIGEERAVEAMRLGAQDYLLKDRLGRLPSAVKRVLDEAAERATRRKAERKLAHLSRIHAVSSGINAAIVRIRNKHELFKEACRIATESGGFSMAWLGIVEREAARVKPVAWAGNVGNFFEVAPLGLLEAGPGGDGLVGRVAREKKAVACNDLQNDPRRVLKQELKERGINSLAVIPLLAAGEAFGVLALYAAEAGSFDEEEIRLLLDLAGDIAFACEHIEKADRLAYLAYYDELTGLPNRTLFSDHLGRVLQAAGRESARVVLVLGDIKRLRFINDTLGRHVGDELLRKVAAGLRQVARNPENLARIGADCFAGVVVGLDPSRAAHLIEQLSRRAGRSPFEVAGERLTVSFTAAATVYPDDGGDAETLLKNAEIALRKAKTLGERFLFYEPSMHARIAETLRLEGRLRGAAERGEFVLHYQPKMDVASGTIVGMEALMRWNDPAAGLVPPMQFIPLLEETGMILDAGAWVLQQALADSRGWHRQGLQPPPIAVNVSPLQLRQKGFVATVLRAIERSGALPHALELEITESLLMQDIEGTICKLKELRNAGVNIVIDDFGTGYSSLSYLARLPIDALKIDRSFVATMANDADSMTIVSAVISLAHSLKKKVIAEGVESFEQARLLRLLNCDQLQGYLIGRPKPAAELTGLLEQAHAPLINFDGSGK